MYKIAILFNYKGIDYGVDINIQYSKEKAIELVASIRKRGGNAEMYPEIYSTPKITKEEAFDIAMRDYLVAKMLKPDNYGELKEGVHSPIYFDFYCSDDEQIKAGKAPGKLFFRIDKITGKKLSKEQLKEYNWLNYGFNDDGTVYVKPSKETDPPQNKTDETADPKKKDSWSVFDGID